jgi:hypothetical protein
MSELDVLLQSSSEVLFILFAAAAIPWLAALVNQTLWSSIVKQVVVYIICGVSAAAWLLYKDETLFAWDGLPRLFILVAVTATVVFKLWVRPIRELEARTDVTRLPNP